MDTSAYYRHIAPPEQKVEHINFNDNLMNFQWLGRADIYVRRTLNLPISTNRRGEVHSPNGLGDPTPTHSTVSTCQKNAKPPMRVRIGFVNPLHLRKDGLDMSIQAEAGPTTSNSG